MPDPKTTPAATDATTAATTPDPRDVDGSDTFLAKVALLRRAAQIAATADPLSMTFRAAASIMEIKLAPQFTRYLERPERTEQVQQMIADLHEVIKGNPEQAGPWVSALRALRTAEKTMTDPIQWRVQAHHTEMAAQALGCHPDEVHDIRIEADGQLIARKVFQSFVPVARYDLTTA